MNARERSAWSRTVCAQLRAERAASGKTQTEVYEAAGVSRSTYVRIEAGTHVIDVTELSRILDVYGLTLPTFFSRVEQRLEAETGPTEVTVSEDGGERVARLARPHDRSVTNGRKP